MTRRKNWVKSHTYTPEQLAVARQVLDDVRRGVKVSNAVRRHPLPGASGYVPKHMLVAVYRDMIDRGEMEEDVDLLASIRMKPVRTLSGVTTVTVLTKPYPCPGDCIFCPDDVRMPKSYLPDEPGAARAFENEFDPFRQVRSRIESLQAVGHPTDKIELLILGGTWDAYPHDYQAWFIQRCLDAMNEEDSGTLGQAQSINETASHRNVGLVVETRPDRITPSELVWLRSLGVTKIQMGAQSLDDRILQLNRRGHTTAQTLEATALLRAAAYKFVLHWMPNLLGATIDSDHQDFVRLWEGYCPDELKIYPTQLLAGTELYNLWEKGQYHPYETDELIHLVADLKATVPQYCRINRIIRDIPSTHVVAGNKRTSLRQDARAELARRGQACRCIRCREVRGQAIQPGELTLQDEVYYPAYADEHFLSYVTPDDKIAAYLRLSLPWSFMPDRRNVIPQQFQHQFDALYKEMSDLQDAALIREVHVYGQSLPVGAEQEGAAQHIGLGTSLLDKAAEIAQEHGFHRLAVISAIGTRRYYQSRGFERGALYQVKNLR